MICEIDGCDNASWNGTMVGNLCKPCHEFLEVELVWLKKEPGVKYSQAARNRTIEVKQLLMNCELFQVREKWEKDLKDG